MGKKLREECWDCGNVVDYELPCVLLGTIEGEVNSHDPVSESREGLIQFVGNICMVQRNPQPMLHRLEVTARTYQDQQGVECIIVHRRGKPEPKLR